MDAQAWAAKHALFKALRKRKKEHWEDFLDNIENIWQAAKYLSDQAVKPSFSVIARVKNSSGSQVTTSEDIAGVLLEKPCPLPTANSSFPETSHTRQLPAIPLTLEEVHAAIFRACPLKGPGEDGLPSLVWQN